MFSKIKDTFTQKKSKDILVEKINEIIGMKWDVNDRELIQKITTHTVTYRYLLPKELENDILSLLDLVVREKNELSRLSFKFSGDGGIKQKRRNSI